VRRINADLGHNRWALSLDVSRHFVRRRSPLTRNVEDVELGAEILLTISREFGKTIEWLLTGE